jgi:hypothetical protein
MIAYVIAKLAMWTHPHREARPLRVTTVRPDGTATERYIFPRT